MQDYLWLAIRKIKPNSQFSYNDCDYSTIKWDVIEGNAPTQAEIDEAIEQVKAEEISEAQTKETQRQALLDRLGITADEAKLLLS
jgi:hypothetical protein